MEELTGNEDAQTDVTSGSALSGGSLGMAVKLAQANIKKEREAAAGVADASAEGKGKPRQVVSVQRACSVCCACSARVLQRACAVCAAYSQRACSVYRVQRRS